MWLLCRPEKKNTIVIENERTASGTESDGQKVRYIFLRPKAPSTC